MDKWARLAFSRLGLGTRYTRPGSGALRARRSVAWLCWHVPLAESVEVNVDVTHTRIRPGFSLPSTGMGFAAISRLPPGIHGPRDTRRCSTPSVRQQTK